MIKHPQLEREKEFYINSDLEENVKYATHIFSSILSKEDNFRKILPDSFVVYKPHSLVSGDFYWINETDGKTTLVVGDCIGHGVSASYLSILALSLLESIKSEIEIINSPSEVLKRINNHLFSVLNKQNSNMFNDNMEITCIVIDEIKNEIVYASEGIQIIYIQGNEIRKLGLSKRSIGDLNPHGYQPIEYRFNPNSGDRIYIMTDGIKSQFGFFSGKKLGSKKLFKLLFETSILGPKIQKQYIELFLKSFKGNLDQTDDICLIGLKLK